MHTVFRIERIQEIEHDSMKIWQVELKLINDSDDQQLTALTNQMRQEMVGTGWHRMGFLLSRL